MDIQSRIKTELERMNAIYKDLPEETYSVLQPLIENAAFMQITLEDLAEEIRRTGAVETYQNGEHQKGRKQAAALQAYDRIIKDYNAVMKTLAAKLPTVVKEYAVRAPWEAQEKTPEEEAEEEKAAQLGELKTNMQIEEARLRQLDGWKREKRITPEQYEREAEAIKGHIKEIKARQQKLK